MHFAPDGVDGGRSTRNGCFTVCATVVETVRLFFRWGCTPTSCACAWPMLSGRLDEHGPSSTRGNSRRPELEMPDEWRIDLDPMPDACMPRCGAPHVAHEGARRTQRSASRRRAAAEGMHVYDTDPAGARLQGRCRPRWRSARGAAAADVTTTWWRKTAMTRCSSTTTRTRARPHDRGGLLGTRTPGVRKRRHFTLGRSTRPSRGLHDRDDAGALCRLGDLADIDDHVFDISAPARGPTATRPPRRGAAGRPDGQSERGPRSGG